MSMSVGRSMSSACLYFSFIQYPSPLLLAPSSSSSPHNSYFSIYCGDFSCSSPPRSLCNIDDNFPHFFLLLFFLISHHKYSTFNTISPTRQRETDACDELQSEKFITWICLWGHCSSPEFIWMEWSNFSTVNYNLMTIKLNFPFLFSLPSSSTHSISTWIALCLNINCSIVEPNENDDLDFTTPKVSDIFQFYTQRNVADYQAKETEFVASSTSRNKSTKISSSLNMLIAAVLLIEICCRLISSNHCVSRRLL